MNTSERLAAVRRELPVTERAAYLNTGSAGPLPREAARVIAAKNEQQLLDGRASFKVYLEEHFPLLHDLRARFARLLGAAADEIALTHHTTEGMNIAVWGLNWQAGDEIVTTSAEHEGGFMPVYLAARRLGLRLRVADVGEGEGAAERIIAALSPRSRLVVLSHVLWKSGARVPLQEIARAAHRLGALVAVDGAQAAGMIPVNVRDLEVDFYAAPGQKWLCGPEGTGALYVCRDRLSDLAPTFAGFFSLNFDLFPAAADHTGYFLPAAGAARFETSTVFWPALYGLQAGLRWLEEEVTFEWAFAHTRAITQRCHEMLAETPGVALHAPPEAVGLTPFTVAGLKPDAGAAALAEMGVFIRSVHAPERLRVSTAFFNTDADLARLCAGLVTLRTGAT